MFLTPQRLTNTKGPFVILCIEKYCYIKDVFICNSEAEFYNFTYSEYLRIKREQRVIVDKCRENIKELDKALQECDPTNMAAIKALSTQRKREQVTFKFYNHCVMHLTSESFDLRRCDSTRSYCHIYSSKVSDDVVAAVSIYENFKCGHKYNPDIAKYHVDTSKKFHTTTYLLMPYKTVDTKKICKRRTK